MQSKGLVKFFLVLLTLICLGQLVYVFPTNRIEKEAVNYAATKAAGVSADQQAQTQRDARVAYLDSMSSETILEIPLLGKFTYQDCKQKQLHLGLDLKGGMSVLLQVDLRDFLTSLADNTTDGDFRKALDNATAQQKNSQSDYIQLFVDAFKQTGRPLASVFSRNQSLNLTLNSSDNQVQNLIRQKANETVEETFKRLKQRIDKLGVVQPNISLDKAHDMISVELPGIENPERARKFFTAAAKLEFWNTYRASEVGAALMAADNALKLSMQDSSKVDSSKTAGPILSLLSPSQDGNGSTIGTAKKNQRDAISKLLESPVAKTNISSDIVWAWSAKPELSSTGKSDVMDLYTLYALHKSPSTRTGAALEGEHVTSARLQTDEKGSAVSLAMDSQGGGIWGQVTTVAARENNRQVAVVLDSQVVSAPRVNEPILGGTSSISGGFTVQEAQDLANILQVGKLPARAQIVQESTVGPSLGQQNINNSLWALGLSFLSILVFMSIYYSTGGLISIAALMVNLLFIIGALASYGTVLTLPGIAGIVLTMGMAVDANVIIYERIREELAEGKNTLTAIADGFKHSMSAVIDGHVTALLTSLVLIWKGIGPIKGFGVVLAIGVIFTLFTAILVSRLIVEWALSKGYSIRFFAPFSERAFKNINWDWMALRKKAYIFSACLIAAGIASIIIRKENAFEYGIDFKGGFKYEVAFDQKVNLDQLRDGLTKAFDNQSTVVKAISTENHYDITTSYMVDDKSADVQDRVNQKLFDGVNAIAGGKLNLDNFKNTEGTGTHIKSSVKVSAIIADDIKSSSLWTTVWGLIIIGIYTLIRFSRWQYSLGIVIAALHDVLITVAIFTLFHGIVPWSMEINQDFIAAILTIVGYSINDTVIVYDRIREYMRKYTKDPMPQVINNAINSTLSRTIITSLTVLMVTFILFLVGGAAIKGFAFALFIGLLAGTYSSIFIAAPVMMDFSRNLDLTESVISHDDDVKRANRAAETV
ncbi:MAG: hypothetical protein RL757_599 [Bacteroidota bacterium]|jgi:SecD/SecF fusion protein